jgi:hypothetical protein
LYEAYKFSSSKGIENVAGGINVEVSHLQSDHRLFEKRREENTSVTTGSSCANLKPCLA